MDRQLTNHVAQDLMNHVKDHSYKPKYCIIKQREYVGTDHGDFSIDKYIISLNLEVYVEYMDISGEDYTRIDDVEAILIDDVSLQDEIIGG